MSIFPESVTPHLDAIIDVHNYICIFLVLILYIVIYFISVIFYTYYYIIHYPETLPQGKTIRWDSHYNIHNSHGSWLELFWTLTPAIILYVIGLPSFGLLYAMEEVVLPSLTFKAIGHQWYWSYEFTEQNINFDANLLFLEELKIGDLRLLMTDNILTLPINVFINLLITSQDVLHSWAVPSLGIKMDAIPGRLNQVSLFINREGAFFGQCSELCGTLHGFMPIELYTLTDVGEGK